MRATIVLFTLLAAARAEAYPQFQFSTGAVRCNQCHYAPAGGGLINGYGRDEAADTISMGGDGGFLHGAWDPPSWLALGGDFRGAIGASNVGGTDPGEFLAFPMQADLYARAQAGPLSIYVNGGLTGAAHELSLLAHLTSREHYVMWRPKNSGPYLRAGRFFAPYGLRLAEHPTYVRRFLGFNTMEETYGISGGVVNDRWELHATAFTYDFWRPVGLRGSGGSLYAEKRLGEHAAAGAQARVAVGSGEMRAQGGLTGKIYLEGPKLLFMAQADLVRESFDDLEGATRLQLAGVASATWMFKRGFMLGLFLERWDEDLSTKGVARDAVDLEFQWFPTAHVEVSLFGRLQLIGTGTDDGDLSQVLLLQAHYYL